MTPKALLSHLAVLVLGAIIGLVLANMRTSNTLNPITEVTEEKESTNNQSPPIPIEDKDEVVQEEVVDKDTIIPITAINEPESIEPKIISPQEAINITEEGQSDQCFGDEKQFSTQLTLFSEEIEKKNLWYDYEHPEKFQDNSGIFHRVVSFVKSRCNNFDYPGQDQRGIKVPKWYAERGQLMVIKNQEEGLKRRDLIQPGMVMFFGKSGEVYNDLTLTRVSSDGIDKVISHIGVVTEVRKDEQGKVKGYVMLHGRGDGKIAQRTHYHSLQPAGLGMPPLGNYNQQWVAIADIRTPRTDLVQQEKPTVRDELPQNPDEADEVVDNLPTEDEFSCLGVNFAKSFKKIAKQLESQKIPYKQAKHSDCSGMVFRVCSEVTNQTQGTCQNDFILPCETGYKDSRSLARWYYENKNLVVVTDPQNMGDLIQVGSVMFYGGWGKKYDRNVSIYDLEINGRGISHVGVVVDVKKKNGKVVEYDLFHGHGKPGTPADITKPMKGRTSIAQIHTDDRKAFSYHGQQWVAIAPHILTINSINLESPPSP